MTQSRFVVDMMSSIDDVMNFHALTNIDGMMILIVDSNYLL